MNRGRKKLKLRALPSSKVKNVDLQKKVEKTIRKVNERIKSVSKKYKGTTYMWSVNKLKSKVGNKYFRGNRLVLPKNVKQTELIKVYKEAESFLRSKESTKSGIKEVQAKAKRTIKQNFETEEDSITDEEVDAYYSLFEDDDFNFFIKATALTPSEFMIILNESIEAKDSLDDFISRLEIYTIIPDENVRQKAINLYNKYIK